MRKNGIMVVNLCVDYSHSTRTHFYADVVLTNKQANMQLVCNIVYHCNVTLRKYYRLLSVYT